MPSEHAIDLLTDSGMELEDIRLAFGVSFPKVRKRPLREGYGFSIELPVVLDLFEAVAAGEETAAGARQALLDVVGALYSDAGCYDYESYEDKLAWCVRDGGCQTCERKRAQFARYLKTMAERWRRWGLPEQYPFAVGHSKGLHTVACSVVRQYMPNGFTVREPSDPVALRAFAHSYFYGDYDGDYDYDFRPLEPEHIPGEVRFHPMTTEETRAWMAEHTGPKGGRHYKRCRRCAPTP